MFGLVEGGRCGCDVLEVGVGRVYGWCVVIVDGDEIVRGGMVWWCVGMLY